MTKRIKREPRPDPAPRIRVVDDRILNAVHGGKVIRDGKLTDSEYFDAQVL